MGLSIINIFYLWKLSLNCSKEAHKSHRWWPEKQLSLILYQLKEEKDNIPRTLFSTYTTVFFATTKVHFSLLCGDLFWTTWQYWAWLLILWCSEVLMQKIYLCLRIRIFGNLIFSHKIKKPTDICRTQRIAGAYYSNFEVISWPII